MPADRLRWLFLDLNSYFASVEQEVRPELRGKPVAVAPVMTDSTCCIAASSEAKAFGVRTGTGIAEARLLCPGIRIVEARPALYVKYHEAIVRAVESCIPIAAVESIDEMSCELWGRQEQVSDALALAQKIKAVLRAHVGDTLRCSIGLAPNHFLSKVASDWQKPDGLTVLLASELPQRLHALKLRDLPGIGARMEKRLNTFGIETMEQLCRLDVPALRQAWGGIVGERFWGYLRGHEIHEPETVRRSIGHSHVLSPELRTRAGAFRVSQKLVSKAGVRLRKMDCWAAGLSLSVEWVGGGECGAQVKLDEVQDTPTLLKNLEQLWTHIPDAGRPLWVGTTFFSLVPKSRHTSSLFENPRREKVSTVVDTINDRFGRDTLYYAAIQDARQDAPTRIAFNRVPDLSEV